jgi:DedD protein
VLGADAMPSASIETPAMGLLDIFKRDSAGATPAAASANVMSGEQAEQARVQARRRLIGAVVLLGIGVVAFPLLFETQPRPIPVDIPIVIPPRDGAPPLAMPPPRAAIKPAASEPVAATTATPAAAEPVADAAKAAPAGAAVAKPAPEAAKPAPVAPAQAKPAAEPSKPEVATAAPAKATAAPAAAATGRFVVQIGAFSEASAVNDVRSKARKAGFATFTQVVKTAQGPRTRVRVGPFSSREEAEKAAAQVKAAGLPGAVLAL